jgi:hypothetical protein
MPEFEKTEFEFPDEKEARESKEQEVKAEAQESKADETEIEIVDDTPENLKGKSKEEGVQAASEEELEKINSDRVVKRIQQLNRGLNYERDRAAALEREKEEAFRLAQAMMEENKKLKGSLNQGQNALVEQAKKAVELELASAKKKFKEAYDSGDSDALAEAQQEMMAAQIKSDRVNNFKPRALQEEEKEVKIPQQQVESQPVAKDTKALGWQQRNQWFGQDDEMTSFALGLHQKLVKSGVDPRSDDYYEKIDARMKQVFPDQFAEEGESEDAEEPRQKKANVVAPVTRSTSAKKVTLTQTQVALAKKLGVPLELYAKQIAEMRKQNG